MIQLQTLNAIARQAGLDEGDLEEYLTAPTGAACGFCGRQHLRRWEQVNNRCESCRQRYLEHAWNDERCRCTLPRGWSCRGGLHHDEHGRVIARPGPNDKSALDHCPSWVSWWRDSELPALRRRQAGRRRSASGLEDL